MTQLLDNLTDRETPVFTVLSKNPDADISIGTLYRVTFGKNDNLYTRYQDGRATRRDLQQKLGPIIARINEKLNGSRIVPGALKGTYRLQVSNG